MQKLSFCTMALSTGSAHFLSGWMPSLRPDRPPSPTLIGGPATRDASVRRRAFPALNMFGNVNTPFGATVGAIPLTIWPMSMLNEPFSGHCSEVGERAERVSKRVRS